MIKFVSKDYKEWKSIDDVFEPGSEMVIHLKIKDGLTELSLESVKDGVQGASQILSVPSNIILDEDFIRLKVKKKARFPYTLEFFEVNVGLAKAHFKRKEP